MAQLENMPETAQSTPVQTQILEASRPVRGPVGFLDLSSQQSPSLGGTSFANAASQGASIVSASDNTATNAPASENIATDAGKMHQPHWQVLAEKSAGETGVDAEMQEPEIPKEEKEEGARPQREKSRNPPDEKAKAFQSYNLSRQSDGMPRVEPGDAAFEKHWEQVVQPMDEDEDLMAESFHESKLTDKERQEFSEATDKALCVWLENQAWKAFPETEAR